MRNLPNTPALHSSPSCQWPTTSPHSGRPPLLPVTHPSFQSPCIHTEADRNLVFHSYAIKGHTWYIPVPTLLFSRNVSWRSLHTFIHRELSHKSYFNLHIINAIWSTELKVCLLDDLDNHVPSCNSLLRQGRGHLHCVSCRSTLPPRPPLLISTTTMQSFLCVS